MNSNDPKENDRAARIAFRISSCHKLLAQVYEHTVDREYTIAEKRTREIMSELRLVIKSMEHDDF